MVTYAIPAASIKSWNKMVEKSLTQPSCGMELGVRSWRRANSANRAAAQRLQVYRCQLSVAARHVSQSIKTQQQKMLKRRKILSQNKMLTEPGALKPIIRSTPVLSSCKEDPTERLPLPKISHPLTVEALIDHRPHRAETPHWQRPRFATLPAFCSGTSELPEQNTKVTLVASDSLRRKASRDKPLTPLRTPLRLSTTSVLLYHTELQHNPFDEGVRPPTPDINEDSARLSRRPERMYTWLGYNSQQQLSEDRVKAKHHGASKSSSRHAHAARALSEGFTKSSELALPCDFKPSISTGN